MLVPCVPRVVPVFAVTALPCCEPGVNLVTRATDERTGVRPEEKREDGVSASARTCEGGCVFHVFGHVLHLQKRSAHCLVSVFLARDNSRHDKFYRRRVYDAQFMCALRSVRTLVVDPFVKCD